MIGDVEIPTPSPALPATHLVLLLVCHRAQLIDYLLFVMFCVRGSIGKRHLMHMTRFRARPQPKQYVNYVLRLFTRKGHIQLMMRVTCRGYFAIVVAMPATSE